MEAYGISVEHTRLGMRDNKQEASEILWATKRQMKQKAFIKGGEFYD